MRVARSSQTNIEKQVEVKRERSLTNDLQENSFMTDSTLSRKRYFAWTI